jgi:hypothetical protein
MRHATAVKPSGGSKSAEARSQTQQLIRHACVIISASGQSLPGSKVLRLVHRYEHQVQGNGWAFWDFIANALLLDADQRAKLVSIPEVYGVIQYLDPTGETAVENVLREQRRVRD